MFQFREDVLAAMVIRLLSRKGSLDVALARLEMSETVYLLAVLRGGVPVCCRRLAGRSFGHASSHSAGKMPAAR